ncbi:MAG: TRAM domain-containing protein, partial [Clostridia bacterium]|nr:TRAM domain-containing protein [Clostridia bacterium]
IRDCRHVCEHFHLPVQAGSNRVLAKMNRGYTREHYLELVEKIKDRVKGASITTDIIVGFPGETEEDFQDTLDLVRRVRFDAAYTFIYSPRRGTPAAEMPDPVDRETKKRWFNELVRLQNKITGEINSQLVGQTFEVLVEGPSKTDPGRLAGRTRTNKIVVLAGEEELAGKLVEVRITAAQTWTLFGEVVR